MTKKTWEDVNPPDELPTPTRFDDKQANELEKKKLRELGVDKSGESGIIKISMQFFAKKSEDFATVILPKQ